MLSTQWLTNPAAFWHFLHSHKNTDSETNFTCPLGHWTSIFTSPRVKFTCPKQSDLGFFLPCNLEKFWVPDEFEPWDSQMLCFQTEEIPVTIIYEPWDSQMLCFQTEEIPVTIIYNIFKLFELIHGRWKLDPVTITTWGFHATFPPLSFMSQPRKIAASKYISEVKTKLNTLLQIKRYM